MGMSSETSPILGARIPKSATQGVSQLLRGLEHVDDEVLCDQVELSLRRSFVNGSNLLVSCFQLFKGLPWIVPITMPLEAWLGCFPVLPIDRRRVHAALDG